MKILYIAPHLPYPLISGSKIKTYSTLKALVKLGFKIHLYTFVEHKEENKYIEDLNKIGIKKIKTVLNEEVRKRNKFRQIKRLLLSIIGYKPFSVLRYYSPQMNSLIENIITNNNFDAIWINHIYMAQYLPEDFKGIKILEAINFESGLYKEASIYAPNLFSKLFFLWEWLKYCFYQKNIYTSFDLIYSIADNDKKSIESIIKKNNVVTLPPVFEIKKGKNNVKIPYSLLYVGILYWYQNKDGLNWFLDNVYPKIQKEIPSIKLNIVGPYLSDYKPINLKGVNYIGEGDRNMVKDFYSKSEVFICPILYGQGIRLKILDAMAYGIPVVSTYKGAEGLQVSNENEILLAKNADEFVNNIIRLMNNPRLSKSLISNGFHFIRKNYSEKIVISILKVSLKKFTKSLI